MAWIREKIEIKKGYTPRQREVIGEEIIDHIIKRSKSGKDKSGRALPGYSDSYAKSKDFRIAGKSKFKVNLTLSDEMLNALKILSHKNGQITIGFDKADRRNNDVAEGNIKGTYGQKSPIPGKKRDFLGIEQAALKQIEAKYPLQDEKRLSEAVSRFITSQEASEDKIAS